VQPLYTEKSKKF
jgi:hypothetical protein